MDYSIQQQKNTDEIVNARTTFTTDEEMPNLKQRLDTDVSELLKYMQGSTTIPYEGEYIHAEDTYLGLTDKLKIEGKTYQNLARLDLPISELGNMSSSSTLADGKITMVGNGSTNNFQYTYNKSMYKPSTDYTLITNIEANTLNDYFYISGNDQRQILLGNVTIPVGTTGIIKTLITSQEDLSNLEYVNRCIVPTTATEGSITYSFMILEGDYTETDLPTTITGIESVNGDVTVKSLSRNLVSMTRGLGLVSSTLEDGVCTVYATGSRNDNILYENLEYYKKHIGETFTIFLNVLENTLDATFYFIYNSGYQTVFSTHATFAAQETGVKKATRSVQAQTTHTRVLINSTSATEGYIKLKYMIMKGAQPDLDVTQENWDYYAQYGEDTITFEDLELRSLPDGTCDYVSVEENGWWECVGEAIATEDNISDISSGISEGNMHFFGINVANVVVSSDAVCDKLPNIADIHDAWDYTSRCVTIFPGGIRFYVESQNERDSLLPITVYYKLETPIFHPLPPETLKSFSGTTHVFSEGSNVEPNISCRISSDVGAVTANAMNTNAILQSDNDKLTKAANEQNDILNFLKSPSESLEEV